MAKKAADTASKGQKKSPKPLLRNRPYDPQKMRHRKMPALSPIRLKDPWLAREQKNYLFPLPSREYILQIMKQHGKPISPKALIAFFGIQRQETEAFLSRLFAMTRDGQLLLNRKNLLIIAEEAGLLDGHIVGHKDGYGFFIPNDGTEHLFLSEREMRSVLTGDQVLVRKSTEGPTAKIVEVTKRANENIVGRLYEERKLWYVIPEDPTMPQMIVSPKTIQKGKKWKNGVFVIAQIIDQPTKYTAAIVQITDILGDGNQKHIEVQVSIHRYGLPYLFSKATKRLADQRALAPLPKPDNYRRDLRHLPLVTIDGEDARDFDDAIYCETHKSGYRLIVAIADVSHYVLADDAIDLEAYNRGNSVYFPNQVIPMLPEALSNEICSLNPDVDRLTMVCDMLFDHAGNRLTYEFYPAIIHSRARLTYNQVYAFLYHGEKQQITDSSLHTPLNTLKHFYGILCSLRQVRGSIDFEIPETQILFNEAGKIDAIVPLHRNEAHKIIEECMLAANVCAASFLEKHHSLGLYRVHQPPVIEKLHELQSQLKAFGLSLDGNDSPEPKDFAKVLHQIQEKPELHWMQMLLLRSLQQANYSPNNAGHFALAYPAYTHFTSPIRRYSDLIVHRLIKAILQKPEQPIVTTEKIKAIAQHCSMTERRADSATRDAVSWLKCEYMKDKIGMVYTGTISSIVSFGAFVLLDNLYVEGLLHITEMGKDYFEYDANRCRLIGQRSSFDYRVGDPLTVKVANVNLDKRQIDFVLDKYPKMARKERGEKTEHNQQAAPEPLVSKTAPNKRPTLSDPTKKKNPRANRRIK